MTVVRFAPSPTGFLHLGSARTALFNWLYARRTGGKFLLRIEDTDLTRSETRFLDEILRDLKWLGLDWDGEPIYQSKRFGEYKAQAEKFVQEGKAYREGEAYIFKVEKGKTIEVDDMIHGKISFSTDEIKDQVMLKSDGSPAYNFCCVVDDAAMNVTHIIRGDDHISNTPKQVLFYEAMALVPPKFAHMPLVMGSDGAKLSKRHGAVAVEEYKNEGYLPEALANYLMLLGWNPADGREVLSLAEAAKVFDVKDMNDVQVRFDEQKLRWLNGEHIMAKSAAELLPLVTKQFESAGIGVSGADKERFEKLIELYKPRMKTFSDIVRLADWFFKDEYALDEKGAKKYLESAENKDNLKEFAARLEKATDFSAANIESVCRAIAEERSLKAAGIIHPTRMAISGKTEGAGLFEIMEVLGKKKVIERLKKASVGV